MTPRRETLETADGHRIALHLWESKERPRGTVHWLHGMAEHGGRYGALAESLNRAGWHLVTHDHRGHGDSVLSERDRGHFADQGGWDKVVGDVSQVRDFIRTRLDGNRLVLGGHSMGSFVALDTAERKGGDYDALVLCGSDYHHRLYYRIMRLPMVFELRRHGPRGVSSLIRALTFQAWNRQIPGAQTEFDWLSNEPGQVRAYMDDPCCGHDCTVRLWLDLAEALPRIQAPEALRRLPEHLPLLVVGGERDPMSRNGRGTRALARALRRAGRPVEQSLFAGGRHEILNDHCAGEVRDRLSRFLDDHLAAPT